MEGGATFQQSSIPHWLRSGEREAETPVYRDTATGLIRHEVLPNMIVEDVTGLGRRVGDISLGNPVLLVDDATHTLITNAERALGIGYRSQIYGSGLTTAEIIDLKAQAMYIAGVPMSDIIDITSMAIDYADGLGILSDVW
jgi:hypothetical protein